MKLSDVKQALLQLDSLNFQLPNGSNVPGHFHVTEVGTVNKRFIDCGGTVRDENVISFQLWEADDIDHRLAPIKLLDIITLSENTLDLVDGEVEVEYQSDTIGKYGLEFNGHVFLLTQKTTDCLAPDKCGVPVEKKKVKLSELGKESNYCSPESGCC